jgi:hypothetical protein
MNANFESVASESRRFDPASVAEAAEKAIERFKDIGIRVHSESRLPAARRTMEATVGLRSFDPANRARADEIADATLTIFDLFKIAECAVEGAEQARIDKIKLALAGRIDDRRGRSCPSRSAQFELVLGSWISTSGRGVSLGEPDLIAMLETGAFGIAAKRLASRSMIVARTREAIDQIESSGRIGIVALNLDRIVRDDLVEAFPRTPEGGILDAIPELLAERREWRRPMALGRICVARKFRWIESGSTPGLTLGGHLWVEPWVEQTRPELKVMQDLNNLMQGILRAATDI